MSNVLTELNRRIDKKKEQIESANKILDKVKNEYSNKMAELKALEKLVSLEKQRGEINKKMGDLFKLEGDLMVETADKDFVLQMEDGSIEIVSKADVEIVSEEDVKVKEGED